MKGSFQVEKEAGSTPLPGVVTRRVETETFILAGARSRTSQKACAVKGDVDAVQRLVAYERR
jgi:hypothetical protein